jgi:hypothetical protein
MLCRRVVVFGTSVWCLALVAVGVVDGQTLDPRLGTWHLNAAKSEFNPSSEIRSLTTKVEPADDGEKVISGFTYADGAILVMQYTAYYDGRDYYLTGSPAVDSVSLQRIDARTTERIDKKRGEVVQIQTRIVSEDGKTMTVKVRGKDWIGQDVRHTLIFEKQ